MLFKISCQCMLWSAGAAEQAAQAAGLARADLATAMVTEMTALAGVMGRHYAQKEGLQPEVAQARPLLPGVTASLGSKPKEPG